MKIKKYLSVIQVGFQYELEYKFNFLVGLFYSFIPFAVNLFVWYGISNFSTAKYGFSMSEIFSYYYIVLIIDNLLYSKIHYNIAKEIRTGNINKYFLKTIDFMFYQLAFDLPKRLVFIIFGTIPIAIIGFLLKNFLVFTLTFKTALYFIIALVIGYIINFLLNFIISILSFFLSEVSSFFSSYLVFKNIAAGKVFPLSIMPKGLYQAFMVTPFHFAGFFPVMILLNKFTEKEILSTILVGVLWIIGLFIISRIIWFFGLRKYSAFGG